MIEPTILLSVEKLTQALRARPERTIKGALLGEQIKKIAPELDLRKIMDIPAGPGSVSKFAERYLASVLVRTGISGSDVVYEIVGSEISNSEALPLLWQTFARPGSESVIALDISNGIDQAKLSVSKALSPNCIQINSATPSELDQIRANFTEEINRSLENTTDHLDASDAYTEWSKELKSIGLAQYKKWSAYRISKIAELFHERLANLNVPLEQRRVLENELKKSQRSKTQKPKNFEPSNNLQSAINLPSNENKSDEDEFRYAIIEVVKLLPYSSLRDLVLPAGAVFDALRKIKNKN